MYMNLKSKKENLLDYLEAFDKTHLYTVIQIFEWFECCEDLIDRIQGYVDANVKEIAAIKRRARQQFEVAGMPLVTDEERENYMNAPCMDKVDERGEMLEPEKHIHEPQRPFVTVGFCPKCTNRMVGEVVPSCESEETGRHFYSECTNCTYYTEIFKGRKGRYLEVKGG
ncbi:unnamed protein product [marine sediment metagenome]|uniref:Uncharacterized protein n=1 Tax=marine sediment metagenome TaxID=412755 RepID=X0XFX0_9ZZZZ